VVEGPQDVPLDQLAQVVVGREQHVEGDLAAAELGHRLVHVPVGGDLHLDVVLLVLLLEVLGGLLVEVLGPVVDPEGGALLGLKAVGDLAGVGRDRSGDRVVGAGQLGTAGAGSDPGGVALAAGRQQDAAGDGQRRGGGAGEEGSAAHSGHGCLLRVQMRWKLQ
jgi:predicted oxidoreductase